jgi:hypothetical protein
MNLPSRIFESKSAARLAVAILLALGLTVREAAALSLTAPGSGLSVRLEPANGLYEIASSNLDWTFAGNVPAPLAKVAVSCGSDGVGAYQQVSFEWQADELPMTGRIRLYDEPALALFSQTCETAAGTPPAVFPDFTKLPADLHVFSYGLQPFAPPQFTGSDTCTPWLLFDDRANAFIISPASHFMVASMLGDGRQQVASGFNPRLRNLPAGFTQETLVAFGKGINQTWDLWGRSLLELEQAKRPSNDADAVLKYLGYWTDNGAYYYYNYDLDKGYAGTLQSLVKRYRQEQIPIRYLQLDSWWYSKTTTDADGKPGSARKSDKLPEGEWNRYGGTLEYKAHPSLFPHGLEAFQQSIGLPLVTHARWVDPASPYHQHYKISGVAVVDPQWWNDIAAYLKSSGVVTYEQDWLDRIYRYSPAFSSNLDTAETFLDNMARACREQGITLQYCMPYPCHFLQGSRYANLTTIRTSGDRFNSDHWNNFLYTSRLAASLGIWPWADVFKSSETANVLLATLSAGPVGIGDAMGTETMTNLLQAVRADGVIVKPDAPIVPLDRSYIADAQQAPAPLIAGTYTRQGKIKTGYVFAYNRSKTHNRSKTNAVEVRFAADELGLTNPVYVYDYFAGAGRRLEANESFSAPLSQGASAFYAVAPVGESGIAFLGDSDKFVGTGRQRIALLHDEPGKLTVNVVFAEKETAVTLHGFAPAAPKVQVESGRAGTVRYDAGTGHFSVEINPGPKTPADRSTGDPVRHVAVVFEMPKLF